MTTGVFRSLNNVPTIFESVRGGHFSTDMLSSSQGSKDLRNMPFPRRGNIYEVDIITSDETFKVSFSGCVNTGYLLPGLLDKLSSSHALLFHHITNGIDDYFFNGKKFSQHLRATQTHANDSQTHHVMRFKPYSVHRSLPRTTSLQCFLFGRICLDNTRSAHS